MTFFIKYDIIITEKRKDGTYQMKRGQIYYADLSPSVGSEQGGKRPVLIIQNDVGNKYSPTTIIAPITSQTKTKVPTHVKVTMPTGIPSIILLEQIRVIDKSRLDSKPIGRMKSMENVDKAIAISLGLAASET